MKYKDWNYVPDVVIREKKPHKVSYLDVIKYKPITYDADSETGEIVASGDKPIPYIDKSIDLNAFIQASAPLCDLKAIYARSVAARDPSLLVVKEGVYGDFVDMPDNIHDAEKMSLIQLQKFEESYEKLPDNIKAVFGSKSEFVNAVLNDKLDNYLTELFKISEKVEGAE